MMRPALTALFGAALLMGGALLPAIPASAQNEAQDGQNGVKDSGGAPADAAPAYESDGIAAIVNDQPISDYELNQRISLFVATSGIDKPTADDMKKIRAQQLELLETEKLELQEALKRHITVSPVERNKRIDQMLAENHLTHEQLRTILADAGTSEAALIAQVTASIAWQKTVQAQYGDTPLITPAEVDAAMARYAEGADKPHYHVAEIFLPVDSAEQDAKVLKNAQDIVAQLQLGAPFQLMARQFSQSPSAAAGGDIGWVHDGQLAPPLNAALAKLEPNSVSPPVRSVGGYYILGLRERLEPLGTKVQQAAQPATPDDGTLPLARITLPLGPQPSQEILQATAKVAAQLRTQITSCDHLDQISQAIKGAVYQDLGRMKIADLSPDIQTALAKTPPGQVTPPFSSDAGVELLVRCDKRVQVLTAYTLPTREEIENLLFDEQITALANRYKRDLKRDANIEVRDAGTKLR